MCITTRLKKLLYKKYHLKKKYTMYKKIIIIFEQTLKFYSFVMPYRMILYNPEKRPKFISCLRQVPPQIALWSILNI